MDEKYQAPETREKSSLFTKQNYNYIYINISIYFTDNIPELFIIFQKGSSQEYWLEKLYINVHLYMTHTYQQL